MGGDASDQSCVCRNPAGGGPCQCSAVRVLEFAGSHDLGLVGFGMVVTEDVQDAVHDEQGDLVVERAGVVDELRERRPSGQITMSPSRVGTPGIRSSSPSSSGNDSTSVGPSLPMCSSLSSAMSSTSTNVT